MSYPQQTFPNIQALFNYMNTEWITNGQELITGVTGNNVVNALANFIIKYTLNSPTISIVSSGGNVVLPTPMTMFIQTTPSAVSWVDDVQNEYYIVNATPSVINLLSGFVYYDAFLNPQTTIPANSAIHIAKAANSNWVRVNNLGNGGGSGGTTNAQFVFLQFIVGQFGSPMTQGQTVLVITQPNLLQDSVFITYGSNELPRNQSNQISYTVQYNTPASGQMTITFNQGVNNGELYIIHYAYGIPPLPPQPPVTTTKTLNFRVGDGGANTPVAGSNLYNPPVNPLIGYTVIGMFQQGLWISPSPTEVSGDINWSWSSPNLVLANGEFDSNTTYTILYQ